MTRCGCCSTANLAKVETDGVSDFLLIPYCCPTPPGPVDAAAPKPSETRSDGEIPGRLCFPAARSCGSLIRAVGGFHGPGGFLHLGVWARGESMSLEMVTDTYLSTASPRRFDPPWADPSAIPSQTYPIGEYDFANETSGT
jgi:hypothetical protein